MIWWGHAIVPFQVGGPVDMYRFDSIRPLVVLRKISGGSRSENGSRTRMVLASLFGTWAARQLNPFLTCLANLQAPSTPLLPKLLYPISEQLPLDKVLTAGRFYRILWAEYGSGTFRWHA